MTNGLFQTNLVDFVTGNQDGTYNAGSDGSFRLTAPELLGLRGRGGVGGTYGSGHSLQSVLKANLKDNWVMMTVGVIGIPIVANMAMKLIRKPIILPANRILAKSGLDVKI